MACSAWGISPGWEIEVIFLLSDLWDPFEKYKDNRTYHSEFAATHNGGFYLKKNRGGNDLQKKSHQSDPVGSENR